MKHKLILLFLITSITAKAQEADLQPCPINIIQEIQETTDFDTQRILFLIQAVKNLKGVSELKKNALLAMLLKTLNRKVQIN